MIVLTSFHAQIRQLRMKSMKLHVANKRGEIELFHMTAVSPLTGQIYIPENSHHLRRPITEILTRCLLVLIDVTGEMLLRMSIEFRQILQTHLTVSSPLTLQIVLEFNQFRHVAFHPSFRLMSSTYLINRPKYQSFLTRLGLEEENLGVYDGQWFANGQVTGRDEGTSESPSASPL